MRKHHSKLPIKGPSDKANRRGFLAREGRPMRAALYARVSTHDQQTLGMQVEAMATYIKDRGWDPVRSVEDIASGIGGVGTPSDAS